MPKGRITRGGKGIRLTADLDQYRGTADGFLHFIYDPLFYYYYYYRTCYFLFFVKSTYQIPLICKVRIGGVLVGFSCLCGGFGGDGGGFVAALESAESELLHCTVNLSRGKKRMWWVSFHSYSLHLKRERKRSSSDPSARMNDASAHYERSSEALACELETPLLLFSWSYCWKSMHFYIRNI